MKKNVKKITKSNTIHFTPKIESIKHYHKPTVNCNKLTQICNSLISNAIQLMALVLLTFLKSIVSGLCFIVTK